MKKYIILILLFSIIHYQPLPAFTITQSGHYTIDHFPKTGPIQVKTSNVTIDLNNKTLTGSSDGIIIYSGISNVTVTNGIIENTNNAGIVVQEGCSRIQISNITTVSCATSGIQLLGTQEFPISNCIIENVQTYSCCQNSLEPNQSAIHFAFCNNCEVKNCLIAANSSTKLSAIRIEYCNGCSFENIRVNDNTAQNQFYGFLIKRASSNIFKECLATNNSVNSSISDSIGFLLTGSVTHNMFINCIALSNSNGAHAAGFMLDDAIEGIIEDNIFIGCKAVNNTAIHQAYGFILKSASKRINIIDCIAQDNSTIASCCASAAGFELEGSDNCKLLRCIAYDQISRTAAGFNVKNCIRCQIKDCEAQGNRGSSSTNSFGFRINNGSPADTGGNQFISNIAFNNGTIAANQMNNFNAGTFQNLPYNLLNSVTGSLINVGIAL